jgi:hypothetical protein
MATPPLYITFLSDCGSTGVWRQNSRPTERKVSRVMAGYGDGVCHSEGVGRRVGRAFRGQGAQVSESGSTTRTGMMQRVNWPVCELESQTRKID